MSTEPAPPPSPAVLDHTEISGDIDTAVVDTDVALQASFMERAKGYVDEKKKDMKPWSEFANFRTMQTPKDLGQTTSRVYHNVGVYKSNYI
eukprot:gene15170-15565_t